jgi:hypothetical protein
MSHRAPTDPIIGHRLFVDGARRPVYQDERGQYVHGYEREKVYGVWPLIIERLTPARGNGQ